MVNIQSIHAAIAHPAKKEIYVAVIQKEHSCDKEQAENIFTAELEMYCSRLNKYVSDPANSNATLTDAQGVNIFLEVMQAGLSFSEESKHIYLSRLKGTGTAIGYQIQADGLIYQAQRAGSISHCSEPVIVQKGEQFTITNTPDGRHVANHTIHFDNRPPFTFENFLAGYVYVVYPNGARELSWITAARMAEHRAKSQKQANYNDESFIKTKIIKNALRKVRRKQFYGSMEIRDEELPMPAPDAQFQPTMIVEPAQPNQQAPFETFSTNGHYAPPAEPMYPGTF